MKNIRYLKLKIKSEIVLLNIIAISLTLLQGCAIVDMAAGNNNRTPHQEFMAVWGRFMGHSITAVNEFATENRFLASRKLLMVMSRIRITPN